MPFSPSATSGARGVFRKKSPLAMGRSAQSSASTRQFPLPNRARNRVETTTTPALPQQ